MNKFIIRTKVRKITFFKIIKSILKVYWCTTEEEHLFLADCVSKTKSLLSRRLVQAFSSPLTLLVFGLLPGLRRYLHCSKVKLYFTWFTFDMLCTKRRGYGVLQVRWNWFRFNYLPFFVSMLLELSYIYYLKKNVFINDVIFSLF